MRATRDRQPAMRLFRRLRIFLGLSALFLFLASSVPVTLGTSAQFALRARKRVRLDAIEAQRLVFGDAYVDSLESIRGIIPEDEPYYLVSNEDATEGAELWVRYALAPRRAVFLGSYRDLREKRISLEPRARLRWVVIAHSSGLPARLVLRRDFLAMLREPAE
jgi:hypothetical protein